LISGYVNEFSTAMSAEQTSIAIISYNNRLETTGCINLPKWFFSTIQRLIGNLNSVVLKHYPMNRLIFLLLNCLA